jgi:hypothetical protein
MSFRAREKAFDRGIGFHNATITVRVNETFGCSFKVLLVRQPRSRPPKSGIPHRDCRPNARKTTISFEVHEIRGGRSNVEFDCRIVGHRKIDSPIPAPTDANIANIAVSTRPAS